MRESAVEAGIIAFAKKKTFLIHGSALLYGHFQQWAGLKKLKLLKHFIQLVT